MLYVFHVDTGTMLTFDMNLLTESVSALQAVIGRACHIPVEKQVLLISGGESLDPSAKVCKYHAGYDTNPIFLFSKSQIEAATPPSPSVHLGSDMDISSQVEGSLLLAPTYSTVISRTQLALQVSEADREEIMACEKLVHDQHLQQQGWAAVVANLEDITVALRHRSDIFAESFTEYLSKREVYLETLQSVSTSLDLLSKIPVLPCLLQAVSDISEKSGKSDKSDKSTSSSVSGSKNLFEWISSQDPQHSLQDMVSQCVKATEHFDQRVLDTLMTEVTDTFKQVDNPSMKEVKGIEDRLYGLDQILSGARKIVQEQSDMAQGFVQNQNRVTKLRDNSILPDLCSSHKRQLLVMSQNHKKLQDTKKKCLMAKQELSINLHTRLRWVMLVQKRIVDVDGKLMIYNENLKRLRKRLDILKQIHDAPEVYAQLVVEVVRRREFSVQFSKWAASLADESRLIHTEEVKRREDFVRKVGHHFLQTLFSGFADFTSKFATEPPAPFDQNLPEITNDDVDMLRETVPELASILHVPEVSKFPLHESACDNSTFKFIDPVTEERLSAHTPPPKQSSLITSEIEIIRSCEERYVTTDHSLSLGDQVAVSELQSNLVVRSEGALSPTEKPESLMPKSLSEALTKEMREANSGVSVKTDVKVEKLEKESPKDPTDKSVGSASTSSGEQLKSTESDMSAQDKSTEDRSLDSIPSSRKNVLRRVTLGTSPDMETSQEFTTADFYIEDSMPSSIADSPMGKQTETTQETVCMVQDEKSTQVNLLEQDIEYFRTEFLRAKEKHKEMLEQLQCNIPILRNSVKDFESEFGCKRSEVLEWIDDAKKRVSEAILSYDSLHSQQHDETVSKLKSDYEFSIKDLKSEAEGLKEAKSALEQENSELHKTVENITKEQKQEREKFANLELKLRDEANELLKKLESHSADAKQSEVNFSEEMENMRKLVAEKESELAKEKSSWEEAKAEKERRHVEEVEDLKKQSTLELEVELDKLRAELRAQFDDMELDISEKDKALSIATDKMKQLESDKIKIEETLTERFQNEKVEISKILEAEFQEKLEKTVSEKVEALSKENMDAIEKLKESHESQMEQNLEELRSKLTSEKDADVENVVSKMNQEFEKSYQELKSSLLEEKQKVVSELKVLHQTELSKMEETLRSRNEKLEAEIKALTERDVTNCEIQTDILEFTPQEVQTDILEFIQKEMQTDRLTVHQTEAQTDVVETGQSEMQTEVWKGLDSDTQTDMFDMTHGGTQTSTSEYTLVKITSDESEMVDREVQTSSDEIQTEAILTHQEHKNMMATLEVRLTAEKDKALIELRRKHEKEVSDMISKLEKDKESSLSSAETSAQAERQVAFNEALSKVTQEKDKVIEELKQREATLSQQLTEGKEALKKLEEERSKLEDVKNRAISHLDDKDREHNMYKRKMEDELALSRQQISLYQSQIQSMSTMQVSTAPSVMEISSAEDVNTESRIQELEGELKAKDGQISNLQTKLSELSMTTSTKSLVQDKVSITSCCVGDLALFCLDERHDQYVVFTIGSTLHFLHSECLESLGLKTNPGEMRKSWVLAEITEKEYCQAKKPQNRFKVPVGTKFYRVKARPWNREAAIAAKRDVQAPLPQASAY
ncbi:hypothetical protein FSP39_002034 [Pinctada imbricata]|uniref:RB1-inducible coiled-coil protein 1 n=1 Tax=Pinctada imbricata TaxID=66713 RepID=A0AA88XY63_PINIB|nr:hypothetical protein FSP39_002034 [Pinctada imbricata]